MTSVCQRQTTSPSVLLESQHLLVKRESTSQSQAQQQQVEIWRREVSMAALVPVPNQWGAGQNFNSSAGLSEVLVCF